MPARSATRALQHPETDWDFAAKVEAADVFGGVDDADLHVVVVDVVLFVEFDGLLVDLHRASVGIGHTAAAAGAGLSLAARAATATGRTWGQQGRKVCSVVDREGAVAIPADKRDGAAQRVKGSCADGDRRP